MNQSNIQLSLPNSKCLFDFISYPPEIKIKIIEMGLSAIELFQNEQFRNNNAEFNEKIKHMENINKGIISKLNEEITSKETENTRLKESFSKKEKDIHETLKKSIELQFQEKIKMKEAEVSQLKEEKNQYRLELKDISQKHFNEEQQRRDELHKKHQTELNILRNNCEEKMNEIHNRMCKTEENSCIKGKISENAMLQNLSMLFPKNNIEDTHKESGRGDFIMTDPKDFKILFENKDYKSNVPKKEIDKFERDMKTNPDVAAGIFMSNESGIAKKEDFQIDIVNNKPVCYLHNTNKNIDKIRIAYNIILSIMNSGIDFSNKELIDSLNQTSSEIKRKIKKCRTQIEKFSKNILDDLLDVDGIIKNIFVGIKIKY